MSPYFSKFTKGKEFSCGMGNNIKSFYNVTAIPTDVLTNLLALHMARAGFAIFTSKTN